MRLFEVVSELGGDYGIGSGWQGGGVEWLVLNVHFQQQVRPQQFPLVPQQVVVGLRQQSRLAGLQSLLQDGAILLKLILFDD